MSSKIFKAFKRSATRYSASINLGARFEQARALDQQGRLAEATVICQEILERQPEHLESLILLAEIATRKGDLEQAIERYARVVDLRPDHDPAVRRI
jgi:cytochrome c-type biogenesis protein CcmH/NrfG